jgi:hypothetical protein
MEGSKSPSNCEPPLEQKYAEASISLSSIIPVVSLALQVICGRWEETAGGAAKNKPSSGKHQLQVFASRPPLDPL